MVNKLCFDAFKNGETVKVKLSEEIHDEIFVGCALIGNTTSKRIIHGGFYEVLGWDEKVKVKDIEFGEEFEVGFGDMRFFRYGYAMTYPAAQGRTLRDHVRLWDTQTNPHFTFRHLSMGLARAVSPSLVDLA